MLKRFFAAFLGSLAAIWVSAALFVLVSIMMIAMIIGASASNTGVDGNSILYLDLSGSINERAKNRAIKDIVLGDTEAGQNLDEILSAIDYAANDSNIKGIYINCNNAYLGYASREELVAALANFKKSGKWIYSYADSYSQSDYYVASIANKMYLNPVGTVDIQGIGSSIPFFKNALDKLGIEMQIVKVGTFKSAVEPYILTEASEPSRMQTKVYIDAIWNNVTNTIAANCKVTQKDINTWADSLFMLKSGKELVTKKIVTELKYRREFENMLRKLTDVDEDEQLNLIKPADYLESAPSPMIEANKNYDSEKRFAVLYAVGEINDEGSDGIVGKTMVNQIIELANDENIKGMVMRVNSPGGSAFASEQIWEALNYFKSKKKPLYVSMGDYAASGGYYISCGADLIFADKNTLTGSIGIFGMIPNIKGLVNDKLGVNFSNIQTNPNAVFPSIYQPMTTEQREAMQQHVNEGYKLFTSRVADGRGMSIDKVLNIAEGRVWDGQTALKIGLVDEIGSLQTAINSMAKKLKTNKYNYTSYPKVTPSAIEKIIAQSGNLNATLNIDGIDAKDVKRCMQLINRVQSTKGNIQARMEDVILY